MNGSVKILINELIIHNEQKFTAIIIYIIQIIMKFYKKIKIDNEQIYQEQKF